MIRKPSEKQLAQQLQTAVPVSRLGILQQYEREVDDQYHKEEQSVPVPISHIMVFRYCAVFALFVTIFLLVSAALVESA